MFKPSVTALSALTALALLTRFAMLNYPRQVVFDEYHFGKFVDGYLRGEYFFDIHPPLGKLLLTASARLGGYNGTQTWDRIGADIDPEVNLFALRSLPALLGAMLVPLMYATARAIGLSQPGSLLPAIAVLFDLFYLVESRYVLTDATLLLGLLLQVYGSFASDAQIS